MQTCQLLSRRHLQLQTSGCAAGRKRPVQIVLMTLSVTFCDVVFFSCRFLHRCFPQDGEGFLSTVVSLRQITINNNNNIKDLDEDADAGLRRELLMMELLFSKSENVRCHL